MTNKAKSLIFRPQEREFLSHHNHITTSYPLIILFCLIGVYSVRNTAADVVIMFIFGILGYLARRFRYQGAPLVLAMVLGSMLEESSRQSLITSRGSFMIFFTHPISLGFLLVAILLLVVPLVLHHKKMPVDEES